MKMNLMDEILSEKNIYRAIYCVDSYIMDKNLLSKEDLAILENLKDKYNTENINNIIKRCKKMLSNVLGEKDDFFETRVYLKFKKIDKGKIVFRPIHSATIITQICIVCILNVIVFKYDNFQKKELSDLAQLIPNNFYGNIPSLECENLFYNWKIKYKEYSKKIITRYNEILKTHKYKYEVMLDLENFFPSINPEAILNFCLKKIKHLCDSEEDLEKILRKLLFLKISNLKDINSKEKYYGNNENNKNNNINLGLPQGLPQACFFGNICMSIIYNEILKLLPGESYFYVDDSVIYTNSENASEDNLGNIIEELNEKINEVMYAYNNDKSYKLKINDEKSISTAIWEENNIIKSYLIVLTKESSNIGFDMFSTMESLEDDVLTQKLNKLEELIDKEIDNIEIQMLLSLNDNYTKYTKFFDSYSKNLYRYKKFFKYRKKLIEYRNNENFQELEKELKSEFFENSDNVSKEKLIEKLEKHNFIAEAQLVFNSKKNEKERNKFLKYIKNFEKYLTENIPEDDLYYSNCFKYVKSSVTEYDTLKKKINEKVEEFSRANINKSYQAFRNFILTTKIIDVLKYNVGYYKSVYELSNEFRRKIYNAYISKIFNLELNDLLQFYRKDNRNLSYFEVLIFSFFRNKNAKIDDFLLPSADLLKEKVDYDLFEVLPLFIKYVKNPNHIEHLILIHKYISSIWKNGSRFLYFYTLHNQEHSIQLIKKVISICKIIDYFQIKNYDYYIIFLCCYLHDISMAIQPSLDIFLEENLFTDELCTSFIQKISELTDISNIEKFKIKEIMLNAFKSVNYYFESISRENHAENSGEFIEKNSDLNLLDNAVRKEVALISRAHVYDSNDVYSLKIKRNNCISEKYLMILLRIADLLDGTRERISLNILRNNIDNMSNESKFHWITHSIIDSVEIKSEYSSVEQLNNNYNSGVFSYLSRENLKEKIIIKIGVNESNLTTLSNQEFCEHASCEIDMEKKNLIINLGKNKGKCKNCIFLCKWLLTKNNYLVSELNALQQYLETNKRNLFSTKINIIIDFSNAKALNGSYYEIVNKKINNIN